VPDENRKVIGRDENSFFAGNGDGADAVIASRLTPTRERIPIVGVSLLAIALSQTANF
jgi:hypothetical protein